MNNKKNELQVVSFEQAKKLKDLGFDYPCRGKYYSRTNWKTLGEYQEIHDQRTNNKNFNASENGLSAPSIALVLLWLRNEKGVFCWVDFNFVQGLYSGNYLIIGEGTYRSIELLPNPDITESELLTKALELLEERV